MPNESGCPTRKELKQLKMCSGHVKTLNSDLNLKGLLELLDKIWWGADWGIKREGRNYELHTSGWSGNEDIINILVGSLFWLFYWQSSIRGGHYYFELPEGVGQE